MVKSKWIDRALIISPVFYTLCTDEADFYRLMKNIKMPIVDQPEFMIAGSGATTHTFRTEEYPVAIVCMNLDNDATNAQLSAMIAHEAVHVFQYILECIGETDPSVEFEAYSIQMITQQLILEYERQRDLVYGNQTNKN
jgi:hypothetical protein